MFENDRCRASFSTSRDAVLFTHYAGITVAELKAAYLNTTGNGLFPIDPTRFASGHRVTPTRR